MPVDPFLNITNLGQTLTVTSLTISLTVNAIVTGLIVFRILKVYCKVRPTSEEQDFSVAEPGGKLRSIIFVIIESGMTMFSIQLIRVILTIPNLDAVNLSSVSTKCSM